MGHRFATADCLCSLCDLETEEQTYRDLILNISIYLLGILIFFSLCSSKVEVVKQKDRREAHDVEDTCQYQNNTRMVIFT